MRPKSVRYCVHTLVNDRVVSLGDSLDVNERIDFARMHHGETGAKTWVWNVRTGDTVLMLEAAEERASGAGR